jgi:hypothetical protein
LYQIIYNRIVKIKILFKASPLGRFGGANL